MNKSDYLEKLKKDEISHQQLGIDCKKYLNESGALNECFNIFESDDTIPKNKYIEWKESNAKKWSHLLKKIKIDLEAKELLTKHFSRNSTEKFDNAIWISTIVSCLKEPNEHKKHFTSVVFRYDHLKNLEEIEREVGPIRDLLIELEKIIGNECFNINKSEPWERWGTLDPKCERLRYPITFETESDRVIKEYKVPKHLSNTDLISGKYVFGGNQLDIFRGLLKVIKYLKDKKLLNNLQANQL